MFESPTVASLLTASVAAYTLGALPSAYVAGRLHGVDIFKVGTRQAGATNVWRHVSRRTGLAVFFCDAGKGVLTIMVAGWMGLSGGWVMLTALAAVLGHWNSVFTRFKGGDGVSTWAGLIFGTAPLISIPPFVVAALIRWRLGSKLAHPTYWGGLAGAMLFIGLSFAPVASIARTEVFALTGLGGAVMAHSMAYHRRRLGRLKGGPADLNEGQGTPERAPAVE
ncbi:MAG: glycerol-3-phosphate acyltransferase [Gemmatimonadetes bacterium]|nr:glycerol-3-phosphate acyltransferase [Gemmatimonadota bacterium]